VDSHLPAVFIAYAMKITLTHHLLSVHTSNYNIVTLNYCLWHDMVSEVEC